MNRTRKTEPSAESQKPSTVKRLLSLGLANCPCTITSVKGFTASGEATVTMISTKSYASTVVALCEKATLAGDAKTIHAGPTDIRIANDSVLKTIDRESQVFTPRLLAFQRALKTPT